ncbi:MAG: transglycosylase domain-containing protein [Thermoanaerobaculia bacterium]|nr:transglycosylase domain-containing protein [Thermoanaerobaculia bacterium]
MNEHTHKPRSFRRLIRAGAFAFGALLAVLLAAALIVWIGAEQHTPTVVDLAHEIAHTGLTPDDLPPDWLDALIAVEDPRFFQHPGVDLRSPGAGWTTITQGLVKLHYPGPMRGLVGKPRQTILARSLDRALAKDLQLALFLNTAYFGQLDSVSLNGFPQAARRYYGVEVVDLTLDQYLGLVAMLVGPNSFDPIRRPEAHRDRVRRIEALLAKRCVPSGWTDVYLEGCAQEARRPAEAP